MFWAMAAIGAGADSSNAERTLLDQVQRLAREPVTVEELERVRGPLLTRELSLLQTARARASALGEAVCSPATRRRPAAGSRRSPG